MRFLSHPLMRRAISVIAVFTLAGFISPRQVVFASSNGQSQAFLQTISSSFVQTRMHIDCSTGLFPCPDVYDSEKVFGEGHYVGHDEPSTNFYSNLPGSGNRMRWNLRLPMDPTPGDPLTKSYHFELDPYFWFGFAMCDTQSFPEQVSTCTPDSDSNIVDPAVSARHPGTAFFELQFYAPGWLPRPRGTSCDPVKWCVALTIFSISQDPVAGKNNNSACLSAAGVEYENLAYITRSGHSQAPASPLLSTLATFVPDPKQALFMNPGDRLSVTMHDTRDGLRVEILDRTTDQQGSMTASAENGFAQVRFDPNGTDCDPDTHNIPYDFHPMYNTSSEQTRTIWAAESGNVGFADELGHFDFCDNINTTTRNCIGNEGIPGDQEPADADNYSCYPASASLLVQVSGCRATNGGFDGASYQPNWPDGNTTLHPTSLLFTSPLAGENYDKNYSRAGFETGLPRIEAADISNSPVPCNRLTGANCTLIPSTDDGVPANFYPFFSIIRRGEDCFWMLGNDIPGSLTDFGRNAQYGSLLPQTYLLFGGGGATQVRFNDFRQIFNHNPCGD